MAEFFGPRCLAILAALFVSSLAPAFADETHILFDLPPAIECRDVTPDDFRDAHPTLKVIEGTLRKQEYQLRQARYQLAQLQYERRQISQDELEQSRAAYRSATGELQKFWDTKLPTD